MAPCLRSMVWALKFGEPQYSCVAMRPSYLNMLWQRTKVGEPNDVFLFAVVMLECLAMDRPWSECTDVIQVANRACIMA